MCAKKDNYFETVYWIDQLINSCNTIEQENEIRHITNDFIIKLLNDKTISPNVFQHFINHLYKNLSDKYSDILLQYENHELYDMIYF